MIAWQSSMLKQRALIATAWSALEQIGSGGIQTLFMLVFARALTPEDFGVVASAILVIGFGERLALFGVDSALVQRSSVDSRAFSTSLWLVAVSATLTALVVLCVAPMIATLFGDEAIKIALRYLTVSMLFTCLGAVFASMLRRNLRMKTLAQRTLIANLVAGLVATAFVLKGFGYIALVIQAVVASALTLFLTASLSGIRPALTFDRTTACELLKFGMPTAGANILTQYNRECPRLFVGVFLGPQALGFFSMATRIVNLVVNISGLTISKVSLPFFSEVRRGSGKLDEAFLRVASLSAAVVLPCFAIIGLTRDSFVHVFLGPQWISVPTLLLLLSPAGLLTALNFINGSALMAAGLPGLRFRLAIARALVGTFLLIALTPHGAAWAAAALLLRGILVEPLQLGYLLSKLRLSASTYLIRVSWPAAAACAMIIVGSVVIGFLPPDMYPLIELLILGSVMVGIYTLFLTMFDIRIRAELLDVAGLWRRR